MPNFLWGSPFCETRHVANSTPGRARTGCVCVCVCVCAPMREADRDREGDCEASPKQIEVALAKGRRSLKAFVAP